MTFILGIDVGTTSLKCSIVRFDQNTNYKIMQRISLAYHQHLETDEFNHLNEDKLDDLLKPGEINPFLILSTLLFCIEQLDVELRNRIEAISICGQMHGVLYWNKECLTRIRSIKSDEQFALKLKFNKSYQNFLSNLYSWEDQRCSKEFLDQLPGNSDFKNRMVYTGFGCATTIWFLKNDPLYLANYCFMGTIMDLIVHLLCFDLEHPVTSSQLAASMGYFDMKTNDWSALLDEDKKFNFPKHILPIVLNDDHNRVAGKLKFKFLGLNSETPIFVALGDLQCAIYSAMFKKEQCAILNSGTSMQLAFPINSKEAIRSANLLELFNSKINLPNNQTKKIDNFFYLDVVPYFDEKYLITSASLNGGNVISFFIRSIKKFISDLFSDIELNEAEIWSRISKLAKEHIKTVDLSDSKDEQINELNMMPNFNCRLYGERNEEVKSKFSINSISINNFEIGKLYYSLCSSILDNIFEMCPIDLLKKEQINKIVAVGSTITDNEIVRICLEQRMNNEKLELIYENEAEADLGVTMVAFEQLKLTI